jgi:superfamily II DNA or RNA helicase
MARRSGLRRWQRQAREAYWASEGPDFQVTATPGAGKTRFALTVAADAFSRGLIEQVIIVAPTDHLRTQWAQAALEQDLAVDPTLVNSVARLRKGFVGYSTTYAQVAASPAVHHKRVGSKPTLVILDEIHHAADGLTWGQAIQEAFNGASRRLTMSGTPFRTRPGETIPFVSYIKDGDVLTSEADYIYGYAHALADQVVRPVVFAAYTGQARWINNAGEVISASLSGEDGTGKNPRSKELLAWRTALNPKGEWVPHVIAAMDERVNYQRSHGVPDAAGLVLASDRASARAYAEIVKSVTGDEPVVVLSDDPEASAKITRFRNSRDKYAVCVRMISEGCDIPRATTIAYMTSYRTPLFFAQAVGRVVRARNPRETATVFLPAVRPLLELAAAIEAERNHVVVIPADAADDELDELTLVERDEKLSNDWQPLDARAEFAHVLHSGHAVTAAPVQESADDEDDDYLGLPGLLTPQQTATVLAKRDDEIRRKTASSRSTGRRAGSDEDRKREASDTAPWEELVQLRRDVNAAVAAVASATGEPHASVHIWARSKVSGPVSSGADADVLRKRLSALRGRLVKRHPRLSG